MTKKINEVFISEIKVKTTQVNLSVALPVTAKVEKPIKTKFTLTNSHQTFLKKIPQNKGYYITGFADGEGSFNTSFRERNDFLIGWKISPVFNISQKEKTILAIIKNHLKCGTIRFRKDGVWVYEVDNKDMLINQIIPFFSKFRFLSDKKKNDFSRFQKIVSIVSQNKSTTFDDIVSILKLLEENSSKNCRNFTDKYILDRATVYWNLNKAKIIALNSKQVFPN